MAAKGSITRHDIDVDGERLAIHTMGQGRRAALVVHGLLAAHMELWPLLSAVADAGLVAVAPDLRGCGQSGGPRGHTSPARALEDLQATVRWATGEGLAFAGGAGHSLGGAYLVHAVAHGLAMPRIVVAAAPASIRHEVGRLEYVGYRVGNAVNKVWMAAGFPSLRAPYKVDLEDTIDDPAARAQAQEWDFLQDTVPLSNVDPLLRFDPVEDARAARAPALFLAATNDRVVKRASTLSVYHAYGGPKEWTDIPGGHSVFLDSGGDQAVKAAVGFLKG